VTYESNAYQVVIGDIGVTDAWIVTPYGTAPLRGSVWTVRESTFIGQRTPTYAIVLAIVFAVFCLLGLLFLLIKETTVQGVVEVHVRSGSLNHMTQLPVWQPIQVQQIHGWVEQARTLELSAPQVG